VDPKADGRLRRCLVLVCFTMCSMALTTSTGLASSAYGFRKSGSDRRDLSRPLATRRSLRDTSGSRGLLGAAGPGLKLHLAVRKYRPGVRRTIVGGTDATQGQLPFMAYVEYSALLSVWG
jgi:hypothetical protein